MPGKTPIGQLNFIKSSSGTWNTKAIDPVSESEVHHNFSQNYLCPNVASHLETCPVCSSLQNKEKLLFLFYGIIIGIVVIFIYLKYRY